MPAAHADAIVRERRRALALFRWSGALPERVERRRELAARIVAAHADGVTIKAIAEATGLTRKTVSKWLQAE